MRQVAERAGVSAKTVSRVMHDDRYVSADVRQRVERAIAELGYVPNVLARTFRSGRDAVIGVAVPSISDPFFAALTGEVERVARARGVAVLVTSIGTDPAHEQAAVHALLGRQVTGLIMAPVAADQSYLRPCQDRTVIVFIDRPPARIVADSVVEDDLGGAHAATTHLLRHGHRRVGFVGDTLAIATTARRLEGYRAALADAGIDPDPGLVALTAASDEDSAKALVDLLSLPEPPTALFSSNARTSIGIIPALQAAGRTDVGLVSFGDFPLAAALQPPVTVIDQDPASVGRTAATRLFERLDHPNRRLKRRIVLPVPLISRGSCRGRPGPDCG
ncbi:LacI family DNA-binding transcriptional regulator [Spirilliplanes yamanashiensis]|nr:LacI family DNA-binding transcriptional regulator [Spirilliplanes yamanashiensis]